MKINGFLVLLGILASVLIFGIVSAGCASVNGSVASGGIAIINLKTVLSAEPENTTETPITVKIKSVNITDKENWADINNAVQDAERYVILDLSDCMTTGNRIWGRGSPNGNDMNIIKDNQFVKGVILPKTLITIDRSAFHDCKYLASVSIPDSVTSIGWCAFVNCTALVQVTLPDSLVSIGDEAFKNTPWEEAFLDSQSSGMVYIGNVAFRYKGTMPQNTNFVLQEGTVGIAGSAFYRCEGLTSVVIPDSVTNIGEWAFGRSGVTSVVFGKSLASIEGSAFIYCNNLKSITIPASVTFEAGSKIGASDFGDWVFQEIEPTLRTLYLSQGAGTYTRTDNGKPWTKQ